MNTTYSRWFIRNLLRCYNGSKQQLNDMKQHLKEIGQGFLFFGLVLIAFVAMVNLFNM